MNSRRYQYEQAQRKNQLERMKVGQLVKIIAYNENKGTVDVQPLPKKDADGTYHVQPPVLDVPISGHRGSDFTFRTGHKVGDKGYVVYVDVDIDNTVASGRETQPNTERMHSQTDAVFVGGVAMGGGAASGLPSGAKGMGTLDGANYIIWHEGKWKIKGDVEVEGNVKIIGNLDVDGNFAATGNADIAGNESVGGNLNVGGNLVVSGTITPWPEV